MKRTIIAATVSAMLFAALGTGVQAAGKKSDPPCTISPSPAAVGQIFLVSESGLPTSTPINLWVTDPNGTTTGYPLGSAPNGTFSVQESGSFAGTWSYEFAGPTKNNTTVYGTCSVSVS